MSRRDPPKVHEERKKNIFFKLVNIKSLNGEVDNIKFVKIDKSTG